MPENTPEAKIVLKEFMARMNSWETSFFAEKRSSLTSGSAVNELDASARLKLTEILERYATKDKSNLGRLIDLGCSNPPSYDPLNDTIDVLSNTENSVVFHVQQASGSQSKYRITLVRLESRWKVAKTELQNYKGKWTRSAL